MRKLSRRVRELEASVVEHREEIAARETELVSDGITWKRRVLILAEIRDLEEEVDRLQASVEELEHERAHARARLDDLQAKLP